MSSSHSLIQAITRRKTDNCSSSTPEQSNKTSTLKRCLHLKDLTMIGIGSTLGAGVYILSGDVAASKAGPAVTLCFGIAAIASILSGMCYAELGCRVPKAGSGYAYLYVCIGELAAFTIGWCLLLSYILGASSVASALSDYLSELTGGWIEDNLNNIPLGLPFCRDTINLSSILLILILGCLMMLGIQEASKVTNVCTMINCATLASLICLLLFCVDFSNWSYPQDSETGGIDQAAVEYFYENYLQKTNGIKDNFEKADESFENLYSVNDTFSMNWSEIDTKLSTSRSPLYEFRTSCQIKDQYTSSEYRCDHINKNGTLEARLTLPTAHLYGMNSKLHFNNNTKITEIVKINPGYGGYIPFTFDGVLKGSTTCFYGFVGFDAIATTGEEAVNPHRDIPKAIVISLMVICGVYLAISGLLTVSFPYLLGLGHFFYFDKKINLIFYFKNK